MRELLDTIGADELVEQMAYERIEPSPGVRAAAEGAATRQTLCKLLAVRGPDRPLSDFELTFGRPDYLADMPDPEELAAKLAGLTVAAGGTIERGASE